MSHKPGPNISSSSSSSSLFSGSKATTGGSSDSESSSSSSLLLPPSPDVDVHDYNNTPIINNNNSSNTNKEEVTSIVKDPLDFYQMLRIENPAPYSAYFSFRGGCLFGEKGFCILSSSPERFIRISRERVIESKPIKGTRPRGTTAEEDIVIKNDLKSSEKDFAENLMIVDLTRNDLGRVCIPGTVKVPKLMHIESYATVHQLVSTVTGCLRTNITSSDAVRAAFPPGSMTGAPKRRSCDLLATLEGGRRGIYSGCIGFFGLGGGVDLNVVIRTVVWTPAMMTIGTGGAIIHMSEAEEEYEEMLLKTRVILNALQKYQSKTVSHAV